MRAYLAGPMSGIPDFNFPAFRWEAAFLRACGHEIVNPAEINGGVDELDACANMTKDQLDEHWRECMRRNIAELVTCEGIFMMPGWERSKGASLEHHIAMSLGMKVVYLQREVETLV